MCRCRALCFFPLNISLPICKTKNGKNETKKKIVFFIHYPSNQCFGCKQFSAVVVLCVIYKIHIFCVCNWNIIVRLSISVLHRSQQPDLMLTKCTTFIVDPFSDHSCSLLLSFWWNCVSFVEFFQLGFVRCFCIVWKLWLKIVNSRLLHLLHHTKSCLKLFLICCCFTSFMLPFLLFDQQQCTVLACRKICLMLM